MTATTPGADLVAIRHVAAEAERLQSDPEGFSGLLTERVVLVNAVGRRLFGRDQVQAAMQEALKTPLANVLTRNEIVDVRFVQPDVAVVSGTKHISGEGGGPVASGSTATFTFLLVRESGAWRIAVAHNTLVHE